MESAHEAPRGSADRNDGQAGSRWPGIGVGIGAAVSVPFIVNGVHRLFGAEAVTGTSLVLILIGIFAPFALLGALVLRFLKRSGRQRDAAIGVGIGLILYAIALVVILVFAFSGPSFE